MTFRIDGADTCAASMLGGVPVCMGRARVSSPGGEATAVRVLGDCSALQRAAGGGRRLTGVASGSRAPQDNPWEVGWELLCGEDKAQRSPLASLGAGA